MRKILVLTIGIFVVLSGTLMAANVSFSYGSNFLKPSNGGFAVGNGRTFELGWAIDKDVTFAVVDEESVLDYTDTAGTNVVGMLDVTGVKITKGIIKSVDVGLMLGSGTTTGMTTNVTSSIVDIVGTVTLVSGSGTKVSGALKAQMAARYMNTNGLSGGVDAIANLNGTNASLVVEIGF